ncbi:MAG: 5-methyltetrahydropteroyltriglutamate--homocysteine S-methyltransferase [Candidatus Binatia bacterium]
MTYGLLVLPHRAEHVGSLLRPRELKEAFRLRREGALDDGAFRAAQDRAILGAIRLQEDVGIETVTDGEFRRTAWSAGFVWALDGMIERDSLFRFRDEEGETVAWQTCFAAAPIRRSRGITTDEFDFVKRHTTRTPKVTMPAPSFLHFFRGPDCADPAVYPDLERFWDDVVAVYRAELADLAARGATYVQFDEVPAAMLCDAAVRERVRARGEDPDRLLERYVAVVNRVLDGRPPEMTVAMHLCRGNLRAQWMAAGGYEAIAERLFGAVAVDAFFLEYDTPRAGGFSPLRFVPARKRVVLGLVSSKTPVLEERDTLRRRIDEASRHVPLERLALSPQCGFASTVAGNPLTPEDQRAKLRLVVETAREVWGD